MHVSDGELKEFIIDSGLVAKKEVAAAEREANEREQSLGDILVSRGALTEDALRRVQAYVLGIPFINLKEFHIPSEVFKLIPEPIARIHNIVAYKRTDDSLEVAMLALEDLAALEPVRQKTGLKLIPRLTDTESITSALLRYQKSLKEEFGNSIAEEAAKIRSGDDVKKLAEDLPVVRIVDTLLRHAVIQGASDIHIDPQESEVLVRYRIGGVLRDAMALPKAAAAGIVARIKILSGMSLDKKHLPQDGRFKMETGADTVSFRVSILPTSLGEKAVLRLLRETGEGFTLEVLGFDAANVERVHQALSHPSGIILVTGPEGSNTTAVLYTMLDILNKPGVNISTIEDPIEYQIKRVNQTQVSSDIGFTFAGALRALLRQDPDIIMVGDIRDNETASLALSAALSGRLVLAAVRADSAANALAHMGALGISPALLASTVRAVIGQKALGTHDVLSAEEVAGVVFSS